MWPYITLWSTQIYMTGIWIVIGFITFIVSVWFHAKKNNFTYKQFFNSLPLLIVLLYVLWTYFFLIIEHGTILPNWETLTQVFSPNWYNFHFVGIVVAFLIYLVIFLKRIKSPSQLRKWIDIFFYSLAVAAIPLWIFLVFGDDFIGTTTSWPLGIQAFTDQSKLSKYSSVLPVWLFLSLTWLLSIIAIEIIKRRYKKPGVWYLGFAVFYFLLSIVFLFQQYPKHGVAKFFGLTVDIKQYTCWIIMILCIYAFIYIGKRSSTKRY